MVCFVGINEDALVTDPSFERSSKVFILNRQYVCLVLLGIDSGVELVMVESNVVFYDS